MFYIVCIAISLAAVGLYLWQRNTQTKLDEALRTGAAQRDVLAERAARIIHLEKAMDEAQQRAVKEYAQETKAISESVTPGGTVESTAHIADKLRTEVNAAFVDPHPTTIVQTTPKTYAKK